MAFLRVPETSRAMYRGVKIILFKNPMQISFYKGIKQLFSWGNQKVCTNTNPYL